MTPDQRSTVYRRLLAIHAAAPADAALEDRWAVLMAAHVVGQPDLRMHLGSHVRMLALAWQLRDWREVAGQVARLALVPAGHALGRLPAGNVGRATVSAFQPMLPPAEVRRLIAWAQAPGHEPGTGRSDGRARAA